MHIKINMFSSNSDTIRTPYTADDSDTVLLHSFRLSRKAKFLVQKGVI